MKKVQPKTASKSNSEYLAKEAELEAMLAPIVKKIVSDILGRSSPKREWYDTDPAYFLLGLDSPEQLRIMVREGILRLGIEVRDIRSAKSHVPRYQFHIQKCESRLNLPPEKRQIKKIA